MSKTYKHLLTSVEVDKIVEYLVKHDCPNVWVSFTPTGLGNIVKIQGQELHSWDRYPEENISDYDSW